MDNIDKIPKHFIDSNIYSEKALFGNAKDYCSYYIDKLGYKNRELGILSTTIVGEIFCSLFKSSITPEIRFKAFCGILDPIISTQLKEGSVKIISPTKNDYRFLDDIKRVDYKIQEDDALHLSLAVSIGCKYFVTIDKSLLNKETVKRISQELKISIKHPSEF